MLFITQKDFCKLESEEQKSYIDNLFKHAAERACEYTSPIFSKFDERIDHHPDCCVVHNDGQYYLAGDPDTLAILTEYLSPTESIKPYTDNLVTITTDALIRNIPEEMRSLIPNIDHALHQLSKIEWQKDPAALIYREGVPQIALRLVEKTYIRRQLIIGTSRDLQCDSVTSIQQQFTNLRNTNPAYMASLGIQYPEESSGRFILCCNDVPFHSYTPLQNDLLCQFMDLLHFSDNTTMDWQINIPAFTTNPVLRIEAIDEHSAYSCFPSIGRHKDISGAITIPLPNYILECLKYELSLPRSERIKNKRSCQAHADQIKSAIAFLEDFLERKEEAAHEAMASVTAYLGPTRRFLEVYDAEEVSAAARP